MVREKRVDWVNVEPVMTTLSPSIVYPASKVVSVPVV